MAPASVLSLISHTAAPHPTHLRTELTLPLVGLKVPIGPLRHALAHGRASVLEAGRDSREGSCLPLGRGSWATWGCQAGQTGSAGNQKEVPARVSWAGRPPGG